MRKLVDLKSQLYELLLKPKLNDAFDKFSEELKVDSGVLVINKARDERNETAHRTNTITDDKYNIENNKIRLSLLEITNKLQTNDLKDNFVTDKITWVSKQKWLILLFFLLGGVFLGLGIAYLYIHKEEGTIQEASSSGQNDENCSSTENEIPTDTTKSKTDTICPCTKETKKIKRRDTTIRRLNREKSSLKTERDNLTTERDKWKEKFTDLESECPEFLGITVKFDLGGTVNDTLINNLKNDLREKGMSINKDGNGAVENRINFYNDDKNKRAAIYIQSKLITSGIIDTILLSPKDKDNTDFKNKIFVQIHEK